MAIHTPLCDFLGTKHPIMLAGMGGVSYAELAAAMCNAG
ncbi:MAG: nitronate monooxygenase, partial [Pseudomonadota bacterium]